MKTISKAVLTAAICLLACTACEKWTETQPVNVIYETLESKNPELWKQYLSPCGTTADGTIRC